MLGHNASLHASDAYLHVLSKRTMIWVCLFVCLYPCTHKHTPIFSCMHWTQAHTHICTIFYNGSLKSKKEFMRQTSWLFVIICIILADGILCRQRRRPSGYRTHPWDPALRMCVYVCVCVYLSMYMCVYIYVYIYICICICICKYIYICICKYIYTYT